MPTGPPTSGPRVTLPPEGSDEALMDDNWIQVARFCEKHGRLPTPEEIDRLRQGGPLDDDDRWNT